MDSSTKRLVSGSVVYFVGNALTQLISLLLLRFVTGNITSGEYGFFNLVTTVSNLAIPFVTLQIADAVFKFALKAGSENEKKTYITIGFVVSAISTVVIFVAVYGLSAFLPIPNTFLVATYVASCALYSIYEKVIRCLDRSKVLVTGNLLKTVLFLALEILLISALDMGIQALLLAHILSQLFFLVFSELQVHAMRFFDLRSLNKKSFRDMTGFSLPLIPNAAFWWLTSSVNNIIVSARLGVGVNGIYSVSGKFSSALSMVTGVLNMSWQDTAVADYGKRDFSLFLTKTFNTYVKLIFSAIAVLIPLVCIAIPYMVDAAYYGAIPYAPFLLIAAGMSAMAGFAAQIFTGKGNTKKLLTTSVTGMVINVVTVCLLVGRLGLWAAVIGTLCAETALFAIRTFATRKEFAKGVDYKAIVLVLMMLTVSLIFYFKGSVMANLIWLVVTIALALILNWQFIRDLLAILLKNSVEKRNEL